MTQTDCTIARLYGLPKTHKFIVDHHGKLHYSVRPVLSCINSPTYFLSKFISSLLTNSIKKPVSHIKNSTHFIQKISDVVIPDDHIIVSFDATSLFTNVPLDLVKIGIEKRYDQIRKHTIIPLDELFKAVDFLNEHTFLQFNNQYYKQIHGSPMAHLCRQYLLILF